MFSLNTSGLSTQVGNTFSDFGPMIILVGGLGLAIAVVPKVIKWLKSAPFSDYNRTTNNPWKLAKGKYSDYKMMREYRKWSR